MANPLQVREPDSPYAAARLAVAVLIMMVGAGGMYVVPVVLPYVQAEFGLGRAEAALPYTMLMIGFAVGSVPMGRMVDRMGLMPPLMLAAVALGAGFALAAHATTPLVFTVAHGLLIGLLGSSASFAPLLADTAAWWTKRRGIAVAVCAAGNYLGGAVWPPLVQRAIEAWGWRTTYLAMGVFVMLTIAVLARLLRTRPPLAQAAVARPGFGMPSERPFGLKSSTALFLLCVAGIACCVAMSMPQVHIVAYCGDLGYGAARGAEMLAIMLGFGIVSRLISGAVSDRIGGLRILLLGSALQGVALLLFLPFKGLVPLYIISALFGLFQGGIVPAYAIIIREYFTPEKAAARVGAAIMCTMLGMALGGWMSGKLFDLTGSYQAAFLNGIAWNLLNMAIVGTLLVRARRAERLQGARPAPTEGLDGQGNSGQNSGLNSRDGAAELKAS